MNFFSVGHSPLDIQGNPIDSNVSLGKEDDKPGIKFYAITTGLLAATFYLISKLPPKPKD